MEVKCPCMYRPLKTLFLEALTGKKWKKPLKWSHVKKKIKKEEEDKKIALLYSSDSVQNICFTINMLCVNSDFTELSWL